MGLATRKEALHESLKKLSPIHLHYVWGLLAGLCHTENAAGKAGQKLPGKNVQACSPNKDGQTAVLPKNWRQMIDEA
jgi:hypothetical protein